MIYSATKPPVWEVDVNERITFAIKKGAEEGLLNKGDKVIVVHGFKEEPCPTNTMRIITATF